MESHPNIKALHSAWVMDLLRLLLSDITPYIQQSAALVIGRFIILNDIITQLINVKSDFLIN